MRCAEFEERLNAILDDRGQPEDDPSLQAHALTCPPCHDLLGGSRCLSTLFDGDMRRWPVNSASTAVLLAIPQPAVPKKLRRWVVGGVLAASLLLLIVTSQPNGSRRNLAERLAKRETAQSDRSEKGSGRRASPRTIATWHQRRPTRATVTTDPNGTPPLVTQSGTEALPSALSPEESEQFRQLLRELVANLPQVPNDQLEPITGGIRPLAVTLGAALDAIRRSIPVGRESTHPQPQAQLPWGDGISVG